MSTAPRPNPFRARPLAAALLAAGLATACASPLPRTFDEAYSATVDARTSGAFDRQDEATAKRLAAGREVVRARLEAGDIRSGEDHVRAAFVLVTSHELEDLDLAHQVAWKASELGDPRGGPLAAEALDRALYLEGRPQRFGTQYVYEPVLDRIVLWDVDPATSDAERQRFGIPPLAELRAHADRLNQGRQGN